MTSIPSPTEVLGKGYPTSDGKPMAESDWHRNVMTETIEALQAFFANEQMVYVSGNLLLFPEKGNKRKHIAPDVFVVRGVQKRQRANYLLWEEGRSPDVVIEITSSRTRHEDQVRKMQKYRDVLKVREYFLFDPLDDYLEPPLQGYRLRGGKYLNIHPRGRRLPSRVLGLHLEHQGWELRLWDPTTQSLLLTLREATELVEQRADEYKRRADEYKRRADELKRLREGTDQP
jgi:Uma2 family endonuclease